MCLPISTKPGSKGPGEGSLHSSLLELFRAPAWMELGCEEIVRTSVSVSPSSSSFRSVIIASCSVDRWCFLFLHLDADLL